MSGGKQKKRVELRKNQKDCPWSVESKKRKESIHWMRDESGCIFGFWDEEKKGRT